MDEEENCLCQMELFPAEEALEMLLVFDQEGIISYANAAARRKLGYTEEMPARDCLKSLNIHINTIFPNTFSQAEEGFCAEHFHGDEVRHLVAYRKNRTCFPVEAKMIRSQVSPDTYICMANDILEKEHLGREIEQVRKEAQQAAKVKSEFVANVTHELRTPVNGILGNVRELAGEVQDERTMKALRLIERCCEDMNKIINNILDFSKLDAGKFTLEPRRFHFRNMLDYVKAQHISKITEKGLDFFVTVSPQIPEYVVGDELRIVQILNNLLSNALKFTSVGRITVQALRTAHVDGKAELFFIVSDTGIGIDEEDRGKLFQSFSQVDASISRRYGGTGLGLSICRQLAELMGGSVDVESVKGRGSNFSFSIWVGTPEDVCTKQSSDDVVEAFRRIVVGESGREARPEDTRKYDTPENREAIKKNLSKLVLCVEMENWEKAEMFMETVRQLTEDAPQDIKREILRLKMAVQKEDYEKAVAGCDKLKELWEF